MRSLIVCSSRGLTCNQASVHLVGVNIELILLKVLQSCHVLGLDYQIRIGGLLCDCLAVDFSLDLFHLLSLELSNDIRLEVHVPCGVHAIPRGGRHLTR